MPDPSCPSAAARLYFFIGSFANRAELSRERKDNAMTAPIKVFWQPH